MKGRRYKAKGSASCIYGAHSSGATPNLDAVKTERRHYCVWKSIPIEMGRINISCGQFWKNYKLFGISCCGDT